MNGEWLGSGNRAWTLRGHLPAELNQKGRALLIKGQMPKSGMGPVEGTALCVDLRFAGKLSPSSSNSKHL